MFKSIIVAIDGSEYARKALDAAADLAELYKSELTVIHVDPHKPISAELKHMAEVEHLIDWPKPQIPQSDNLPDQVSYSLKDAALQASLQRLSHEVAQRTLDDAADALRERTGKEIAAVLEDGDPAKAILREVETRDADLVVLGSRGLSALERVFRGSVSTKVSNSVPCSCLVVH